MDTYRIIWSDTLLIGEDTVDAQHKKLIEMIGAVKERETPDDPRTLAAALEYAGTHFHDEEALMERVGYPELAAHRNDHKRLTRTLGAYKKEYESGKTDLYAFKNFMFSWVRDHIMDEDRKLGLWLKQSGR